MKKRRIRTYFHFVGVWACTFGIALSVMFAYIVWERGTAHAFGVSNLLEFGKFALMFLGLSFVFAAAGWAKYGNDARFHLNLPGADDDQ